MMKKTRIFSAIALLSVAVNAGLAHAKPELEILAQLEQRPGNPAVTPNGDVFVSMHPFDNPKYKVLKLVDGEAIPYPNAEFSSSFHAVIGIQATQNHELWWLEMGGNGVSPKLVGWNTKTDQLKDIFVIPNEVSVGNSFHQDFAIDEKRGKAFIADMSRGGMIDKSDPAIVVVDLETGQTRRVLSGHKSFQPAKKPIIAEGKPMKMADAEGKVHEIKLGLNPIAIDPENEWVYFASMTEGNLYRVPAAVLGDFDKSDKDIAKAIEVYGKKPSSDGIAAGNDGKVFVTNVDKNAISVVDAKGTTTLLQDDRLVWPDGLYVAPDQSIVVTVNQLNRAPAFNGGKSGAEKPFNVMRISEK